MSVVLNVFSLGMSSYVATGLCVQFLQIWVGLGSVGLGSIER